MNSRVLYRLMVFTFLFGLVVSALAFASLPVSASSPSVKLQATVVAPQIKVTAVVPNTGSSSTTVVNNNGGFVGSWTFWAIVIIGIIAIIALIVALASRGGTTIYRE